MGGPGLTSGATPLRINRGGASLHQCGLARAVGENTIGNRLWVANVKINRTRNAVEPTRAGRAVRRRDGLFHVDNMINPCAIAR